MSVETSLIVLIVAAIVLVAAKLRTVVRTTVRPKDFRKKFAAPIWDVANLR